MKKLNLFLIYSISLVFTGQILGDGKFTTLSELKSGLNSTISYFQQIAHKLEELDRDVKPQEEDLERIFYNLLGKIPALGKVSAENKTFINKREGATFLDFKRIFLNADSWKIMKSAILNFNDAATNLQNTYKQIFDLNRSIAIFNDPKVNKRYKSTPEQIDKYKDQLITLKKEGREQEDHAKKSFDSLRSQIPALNNIKDDHQKEVLDQLMNNVFLDLAKKIKTTNEHGENAWNDIKESIIPRLPNLINNLRILLNRVASNKKAAINDFDQFLEKIPKKSTQGAEAIFFRLVEEAVDNRNPQVKDFVYQALDKLISSIKFNISAVKKKLYGSEHVGSSALGIAADQNNIRLLNWLMKHGAQPDEGFYGYLKAYASSHSNDRADFTKALIKIYPAARDEIY